MGQYWVLADDIENGDNPIIIDIDLQGHFGHFDSEETALNVALVLI